MLFLQQLRCELRKLFARPRTWMGYGAFILMEAVILIVFKLEGTQRYMRRMMETNGLEFGSYYSSLTITFSIMLFSMFMLGSIYFALVAGDIVAKENEDGNLRMVFARPISRLRLLGVKYVATAIYTFSFVFFVGITGYGMAVAAVGRAGGLFVMEPQMKVFAAYPDWWEGAARLSLGAAGIGISMITLSSIAFMFSCFRIKPAAATIVTLSILFVDFILQRFPFFKPYEAYFVTWRMSAWVFLMEQHLSWPKIIESYAFLLGLNTTLFMIGWLSFQTRDFKT
ncbi:ABC transporter permease [Luteolibacter yonseiensis]|uniref:ABC transporter permease n=1 Tax=Luteolibacter yonseiensis TaxID=1144680 RepID=A0A934V908_9BACT|nr:ABC transporter permease [Luteolibacter yonseiensis]MBK1814673.1 ABC transporter permease [Luteolibacter yonseiensis]